MNMAIKMFQVFGVIWNERSNIAQFWFSKSFFYVKHQVNLSIFFIEEYENKDSIVKDSNADLTVGN